MMMGEEARLAIDKKLAFPTGTMQDKSATNLAWRVAEQMRIVAEVEWRLSLVGAVGSAKLRRATRLFHSFP